MPFRLPNFNLIGNLWRTPDVPSGAVSFQFPCQLYITSKGQFDIRPGIFSEYHPPVYVRAPKGTEFLPGDVVEIEDGSGWYYLIRFVERMHLGFPNEYFVGIAEQWLPGGTKVSAGGVLVGGDYFLWASGGRVGLGGVLVGGSATVWVPAKPMGNGGVLVGGDGLKWLGSERIGRGGVLVDGNGRIWLGSERIGLGGVLVGGDFQRWLGNEHVGRGGVLVDGNGEKWVVRGPVGRGGVLVDGNGQKWAVKGPIGRGGVLVDGNGQKWAVKGPIGRGGVLVGGNGIVNPSVIKVGSGGVLVGGDGIVSIPSTGDECSHALPMTLGVPYVVNIPLEPTHLWLQWGAVGAGTHHLKQTAHTGSATSYSLNSGACGSLTTLLFENSISDFDAPFSLSGTETLYLHVSGLLSGSGTFTIQID